ncbi:hypothetical protein SAICODRAFT_5826 [Saitoella complicata NRRL Y-17804]|uniref:receptor protein-tyrosine kinase n=1 Tax=Saitoella complicata (strain BCRC 22490 / CBS 7301 / JCM 7358 / NBRC 10748 / NRRL Y-17804) TaxID=698492 RepID=A0A0E9NEC9_SAICN|nr:uncharacterized protein SAICODRAFT_5826 [Saitoella complicata NRRL Y-17804]ODQ54624.1 hypothetical protein SAICODRAFT_5826 [Saitoella complicata NRRL Y-17804]GAO48051.1 hypothetical protein G7K_2239-t1 [Saitoella complicata NRRL Y-17804]
MRILSFITALTLILSISLVSGEGLLGRRDCVTCPDIDLSCPSCDDGETCILSTQTCDACASVSCVNLSGSSSASSTSASSDGGGGGSKQTGSIAGGVVGGLAFVALLITAFWFWHRRQIRRRRGGIALPTHTHTDPEKCTTTVTPKDTNPNSSTSKNRRTMASIASTIFTSQPRGSNVIPIHLSPQLPSNATMPTLNIPPSHIHTANLVPVPSPHLALPQNLSTQFFSADDLLRVSYASSQKSGRESIGTTRTRDTAMVVPVPAAVSAGAKARLMTLPGKSASRRNLTTPKGGSGLASTWEDSEEEESDDDDEEDGVVVHARVQQEEKKSPFGDEFSVMEKEL